MTVVLVLGELLFQIPLRGSITLLYLLTIPFIVASLAVGLLISTVARTQAQAMQMAFFFMLPNILLSGYIFPRMAMPVVASAQTADKPTTPSTPASQAAPAAELLKPEQLEALVAPIALYPDDLLANVLAASTYPLEVVQADRWLKERKSLKGDALKTDFAGPCRPAASVLSSATSKASNLPNGCERCFPGQSRSCFGPDVTGSTRRTAVAATW